MPAVSRRVFLKRMGGSTLAVVTLGLAACSSDPATDGGTALDSVATSLALPSTTLGAAPTTTSRELPPDAPSEELVVERLALGSVAAFLVSRGANAAVIDTGNPGSSGSVEAGLTALGLGWEAVGDVILTHRHNDHVGSLSDILTRATNAVGHAGPRDIDGINSPKALRPVGDGDEVFGLQIIDTPGHTSGHIAIWDSMTGALFAGDALTGDSSGRLAGPNSRFTSDMAQAVESVAKMAAFEVTTIYVGHGEAIVDDAAAQLVSLARSL